MRRYLKDYVSEFDKQVNYAIMNKDYDRPLVEYLKEVFKSLEFMPQIKILGFDYNEDEGTIDINDFIIKRNKRKKRDERVNYKFTADERYGCLTVYVQITVRDPVLKNGVPQIHRSEFPVKILVPLQDENGYYLLKGKPYMFIYQMVDKSLYSTAQCVTVKSLMPVCVKRITKTETDIRGNEHSMPIYNVFVFRKEINTLLFYACEGLDSAFQTLDVFNVLEFVDAEYVDFSLMDKDDKHVYFRISNYVYLRVNAKLFEENQYVRAITGMTLDICSNRLTMDDINNKSYWIKKLGGMNLGKGESLKISFNRMLDETTKRTLLLDDTDKKDIYALLRWVMMNFNELRHKDNLNIMNKRLRCNEYVASLLTKEFSIRCGRVINKGNKADMESFREIFKFAGDILISAMHRSGILRFDDNINDMDFFSKFKWTAKGPHSVGGKNPNNTPIGQKAVHASQLGYTDVLVSSNNEPGTHGTLSPWTKLDGLYFDDAMEPNEARFKLQQEIAKVMEEDGVNYISFMCPTKEDYLKLLNELENMPCNHAIGYGTSTEEYAIVIDNRIEDDSDDDADDGIDEEDDAS